MGAARAGMVPRKWIMITNVQRMAGKVMSGKQMNIPKKEPKKKTRPSRTDTVFMMVELRELGKFNKEIRDKVKLEVRLPHFMSMIP